MPATIILVAVLRLDTEDFLKLIKKLKREMPRLRIPVYSALEESIFAERAINAGATGYVMKHVPRETLATAIREVANGGIYVNQEETHKENMKQKLQLSSCAELRERAAKMGGTKP